MICTCDYCHYTFEAEQLPSYCPGCRNEMRNHRVDSKIFSVPCVRPATEDEISWYEQVLKDIADEEARAAENAAFAEKLKMLGEPYFREEEEDEAEDENDKDENLLEEDTEDANEDTSMFGYGYPPDPYNLSVHEHNFALMTLYYLRSLGFYGKQDLQKIIMSTDADEKVEIFKNIKKVFNRAINTEESGIEKPQWLNRDVWENATPALKTLYSFRQDDDWKMFMRDVPNRGNIKRIDLQALAENPSDGFRLFLTDLYNALWYSKI